jgi:DNA polymerase-3 subunit alpha
MTSDYFPVHTHSQFSGMDGMNEVKQIVSRVKALGQPAWALTDHGLMGGVVQGYKESKKAGLAFFPGEEFYLVRDVTDPDTKGTRYHVGMLALDVKGYEALTRLSTLSWQPDHFYYKPLIDLSDLAFLHDEGYSDSIALTTGCFSSMVVQSLVGGGNDPRAMIRMFRNWFPNTTYVELQNHGVTWRDHGTDDVGIMQELYVAAKELGLPVVFGADSHYISPEQQSTHDLMKDICYFGAGEDIHFSGGPYHLLDADEVRAKVTGWQMKDIEEGHADLLDRHRLTIPPLDGYKFQVPRMFKNADDRLREEAEKGLQARLAAKGINSAGLEALYDGQLDHELDVIKQMGFANYHLLVKTHITDWCRDNGIIVNTRGSANGSLVCYALGITEVDPIQWNTTFERYLSLERMKPPDIDVDVDFKGRHRVVEHLRSVFPTTVQVGTYAQIGFGKPDEDGNETGSVVVQYMAAMRKKDPQGFNGKIKQEHRKALDSLAQTPVYKSMGTNAAGFILPGDNYPISRWLPLARVISSDTTVTQFNKDDVEAMGYLKIDVLGLRALQTLNGTLVNIGKQPNQWDWIPDDDKAAVALLRRGHTAGVFQYEGYTNRKGAMEMKVKTTLDCILGVALYRPALINGGQKDQYLHNRNPKNTPFRLHPIFDKVVADTCGVPLYQEQIMQMLQAIGMQFAEYNELMTAIKASNGFIAGAAETFKRLMPVFYDLCEESGLDDFATDDAWNAVVGFTEYGFNRAHSTSYGLMAYRAAYLKAHYPKEFMLSLLSVWSTDKDKLREYTSDARRMGFSVVKPDVNDSSGLFWTSEPGRPNSLRKSLVAIPGIGEPTATVIEAERVAHGPYRSIQDFIDRLPARPVSGGKDWKKKGELKGVCLTLYEANAFRSVGNA